ncbi:hypothetical protein CRG98_022297 [Punica granatum]|uniref:Telomerase reverse transcriptase n=1 Tax=Punica granatum TaxID=22663 RepID=A0A2I0JM12_PUNGR|nr:hypothetical protein CRG98_022297 [Punica granatum]
MGTVEEGDAHWVPHPTQIPVRVSACVTRLNRILVCFAPTRFPPTQTKWLGRNFLYELPSSFLISNARQKLDGGTPNANSPLLRRDQMPKKQRVPEVLWRLFGGRARPLLQMIVSLLPPPPPLAAAICERCARCKWRRCLGCSCGVGEAEAASFLLRPDDPQDYRKLLSQCFVVVDDNVPPYSGGYDVVIVRTQRQIVVNVIMKLRMENTPSANVICNGYDKLDRTSATLELLASSAWCLLSERAGGPFMSYLLSNASIFLPMSGVKYCQHFLT